MSGLAGIGPFVPDGLAGSASAQSGLGGIAPVAPSTMPDGSPNADATAGLAQAYQDWRRRGADMPRTPDWWTTAAQQYLNTLLMGSTAPVGGAMRNGLRAFHGGDNEFPAFDPTKVGSGAMADRWAPSASHKNEYYLTTSPEHAAQYGPVVNEFQIDKPLLQKDAHADLNWWAKENGYSDAQSHINDYFEGDPYQALDADNYFKDALAEAKRAGLPGAQVSFGDLKMKLDGRTKPVGDVIILHDPSAAARVSPR